MLHQVDPQKFAYRRVQLKQDLQTRTKEENKIYLNVS